MPNTLEVIEGEQLVSSYTEIIWRVNVIDQMAAPNGATLQAVHDLTNNADATTTIMPSGSASIESTSFVKLPIAKNFVANRQYSIRYSFTDGTNILPGEIKVNVPF